MGGWSAEREVSLVSGRDCARALREEGFNVTEIDAGQDIADVLRRTAPDVVFNALHGRWGEDGCIQGLLEILQLRYTHSGVLASALAMHKERAKDAFRAAGIPVVASKVVPRRIASQAHQMKPPYVVKPVNEGSSVGVFIIREGDNRPPGAIGAEDWTLGDDVMVEEFVPGRELTVAVMDGKALAVTEISTKAHEFYDYDSKYAEGGSVHTIPAPVSEDIVAEAMRYAEMAHTAMGCRGVSRTDFRFDDTGPGKPRLIVLEINTQPGMTPTSLVPEQAAYRGISFGKLCSWMVEDASCGR
jgi:D-alanine-D-alanine ligase